MPGWISRTFVVLLAVVALVAVACGSGDHKSASKVTTTTKPPATGTPVKLMVYTPTGTNVANFPESISAVKAAVDAINAGGGINNHPLEVVVCNEGNDPNQAARCAQQAVDKGVVAAVGGFSQYGAQMHPILLKSKIATIGLPALSVSDYTSNDSFLIDAGALAYFSVCPQALKDVRAKKAAILRIDVATAAGIEAFIASGGKTAGLEIARPGVAVPTGAADFTTPIAQVKNTGADSVVVIFDQAQAVQALQAAGQSGTHFAVCTAEGVVEDQNLAKLSDAGALGKYTTGGALPTASQLPDLPEGKRYLKEMNAATAGGDEVASIHTARSLRSWLSVQVAAQVLKGMTGEVTAATFWDAISQAKVDLGLVPPIDFARPGTVFPRIFNPFVRLAKWDPDKKAMVALDDKLYNFSDYAR